MQINTSIMEQTARLRSDLKLGRPVLVRNQQKTSLIFAVETLKKNIPIEIKNNYLGVSHLTITARRAKTLNTIPYDGDLARVIIPKEVTFNWLLSTADPALDLEHPMKGPFETMRSGEIEISRSAIELCKKAQLLPAAIVVSLTKEAALNFESNNFLLQSSSQILEQSSHLTLLQAVSAADLPLKGMPKSRIHVFRDNSGNSEHYAIEFGSPSKEKPLLSRLHCACFTGDVIGSLKCDCGPQLKSALNIIAKNGSGMLIYLNQEGRGIGLANKMRAYSLQDQGFDTVEANHRLGFEDEERDLKIGAQIIQSLGFNKVRLLTNNPQKVKSMAEMGVIVTERLNLLTEPTKENATYLSTKASKSGHII